MLSLLALLVGYLRGVLAGLDRRYRLPGGLRSRRLGGPFRCGCLIEPAEVGIGPHARPRRSRHEDRILIRRPVAAPPFDRGCGNPPEPDPFVELPAVATRIGFHETHQVIAVERLDEVLDHFLAVFEPQICCVAQDSTAVQETAEAAARGQSHAAGRAVRTCGQLGRRLVTLPCDRPRVTQILVAARLHLTPPDPLKHVDVDREPAPCCVQQRLEDVMAGLRVRGGQEGMVPLAVVGGELVEAPIVDAQHPALLQVRQIDAPTPPQVEIQPIRDDILKSVARVLRRGSLHLRVEGVRLRRQVHGLNHLRGQAVVAQTGFARRTQRLPEPGPQQRHSHEVVEMPRLQRRVLAVVGERQQLAGLDGQLGSAAKVPHRGDRGDRCGSRTALGVQRRQPGEVAAAGLRVRHLTSHAEPEPRPQPEPDHSAVVVGDVRVQHGSVRRDPQRSGDRVSQRVAQTAGAAVPVSRQTISDALRVQRPRPGIVALIGIVAGTRRVFGGGSGVDEQEPRLPDRGVGVR